MEDKRAINQYAEEEPSNIAGSCRSSDGGVNCGLPVVAFCNWLDANGVPSGCPWSGCADAKGGTPDDGGYCWWPGGQDDEAAKGCC